MRVTCFLDSTSIEYALPVRGVPLTGSGTVIQDHENKLNAWFKEKGVDWVLLRPDRFIAAAGRADDAPAVMQLFLDRVAC